ncbi:MAG: hypothetical protein J6S85_18815 [Methanobrevibacter sp.]|nr:hypothetical protein [Methanobrevibacter sp.]
MRRMITNKQVVEVVNKAIDDGEIEVGGLPEIESGDAGKVLKVNEQEDGVEWGEAGGADNALVLPEEAPASQQLVGVNTSNEQNSLGIGDGLVVENNVLKEKICILNAPFSYASASGSITLTAEQKAFINAYRPTIKIIFSDYYEVLLTYNAGGSTGGISGTSTYTGVMDGYASGEFAVFLTYSGQKISYSSYKLCTLNVQPNSNADLVATYSANNGRIITDSPSTLAVSVSSVSISSGDTITSTGLKNLIRNGAIINLNDKICYPINRSSTSPYVSQYFSIGLNGTSIEVTHYNIQESNWVITFTTKTLS